MTRTGNFLAALVGALVLAGCTRLGPRSVTADRFDYSTAIADSWKQQTLLNIVKLRYADLPVFVDVSSIVAGYSIETDASIGGLLSSENAGAGNNVALGVGTKYTDRPTITYVPMTGEKFLRGLLTPIEPKNIFSMLQSGYPADFILSLTVESLNGVRNRSATGGRLREADPEFKRALDLMRDVQAAGAMGIRVEEDKTRAKTTVLFLRRHDVTADIMEKQAELRRIFQLPAAQERFILTHSPARGAAGELAVNSRSMLQIMGALASYIDLPEEHQKDHSAAPSADENAATELPKDQLHIHSGKEKPASAYAAAHYRGYWFWIDEDNWEAKRALTATVYFFTLAETGDIGNLPVITIPAQ